MTDIPTVLVSTTLTQHQRISLCKADDGALQVWVNDSVVLTHTPASALPREPRTDVTLDEKALEHAFEAFMDANGSAEEYIRDTIRAYLKHSSDLTVVLWEDRHASPTTHLFSDRDKAIEWARARGREFDRHGSYAEETYGEQLVIRYSVESDRLTVMAAEIDKDLAAADA